MIAQTLSFQNASVHTIMSNDPKMRKLCAKLVPKVLMDEQKANR